MLPFAVIGSEEEIELDGEPVRARVYPWGIAEVDNPQHSDFSRLRSAILRSVISFIYLASPDGDSFKLSSRRLEDTHRRCALRDLPNGETVARC